MKRNFKMFTGLLVLVLMTFLSSSLMAQSLTKIRVTERGSVKGAILNFSPKGYNCQAFVNGKGTLEWVTVKIPKAKLKVDLHGNMSLIEKETPVSIDYNNDRTIYKIGNVYFHYNNDGTIYKIGNVYFHYNNDGTIYKIGNVYFYYNNDGTIYKIGNVYFYYNNDGTIYKIGNVYFYYDNDGKISKATGNLSGVSIIIVTDSGSRKRLLITG